MKPEGSLPCSQQPAINSYPEPDESSPHLPTVSLWSILSLSFHLCHDGKIPVIDIEVMISMNYFSSEFINGKCTFHSHIIT
jgi:hypothetical protein